MVNFAMTGDLESFILNYQNNDNLYFMNTTLHFLEPDNIISHMHTHKHFKFKPTYYYFGNILLKNIWVVSSHFRVTCLCQMFYP